MSPWVVAIFGFNAIISLALFVAEDFTRVRFSALLGWTCAFAASLAASR